MRLIHPNLIRKTTRFKPVNFPKEMSNELAELIGIHFGDGNIYLKKSSCRIAYCFNIKETELIARTKYLFNKLFHRTLRDDQIRKNAIVISCTSKLLGCFLKENFQLPFGKKDNLLIPKVIKSKEEYIKTTKCQTFAKEIQEELIKLGFRATLSKKQGHNYCGFDVVLHGKKQYKKWLLTVSNKKKLKKSGDAAIRTRI